MKALFVPLLLLATVATAMSATYAKHQSRKLFVELQALECLRDAGPDGGYIMAPDHSYHSAIPSENIWRVFETCKQYGRYPLDMDAINERIAILEAELGPELALQPAKPPAKRAKRRRRVRN